VQLTLEIASIRIGVLSTLTFLIIKIVKTKKFILLLLFLIIPFTGCEKEKHPCATCSETVSWTNHRLSYGAWTLQEEGGNGSSEGFQGLDATNLISDCGWKIIQDTTIFRWNLYDAQSCEGGVIFDWLDQRFTAFTVQEGWTGSTEEGIKLGDDTTKFLQIYPYFKHPVYKQPAPPPDKTHVYFVYSDDAEGEFVGAQFTKSGKLLQLYLQKDPE
jgi:hypothetical protein